MMGAGGGLGHLGVQMANKMGFKVVGIEAADGPLSLLREVSKEPYVFDARTSTAEETKADLLHRGIGDTENPGVDAVIVLTEPQEAFGYALTILRKGGTCMLVSFPRNGYRLSPLDPISRGIKIVGSSVGSAKCLREMMLFVAKHGIRSRSKIYPFEQLNQLVEDSHHSSGGKYVLEVRPLNTQLNH